MCFQEDQAFVGWASLYFLHNLNIFNFAEKLSLVFSPWSKWKSTEALARGLVEGVGDGGAMPRWGIHPAPTEGRSLRSIRTVSSWGTSFEAWARY